MKDTHKAAIKALIAEGLDVGQTLIVFAEDQALKEPHLMAYREGVDNMRYVREGEVECDLNTAIVSKGEDAGAYVLGWIWVEDEVAGIEAPDEEEEEALEA